jgi:hypothetical protein
VAFLRYRYACERAGYAGLSGGSELRGATECYGWKDAPMSCCSCSLRRRYLRKPFNPQVTQPVPAPTAIPSSVPASLPPLLKIEPVDPFKLDNGAAG